MKACAKYSDVATSNAIQAFDDGVVDESSLIVVGDGLVRHEDKKKCKNNP